MCKNAKIAQFQCFRVFGDTNTSRADYNDDGHYESVKVKVGKTS